MFCHANIYLNLVCMHLFCTLPQTKFVTIAHLCLSMDDINAAQINVTSVA